MYRILVDTLRRTSVEWLAYTNGIADGKFMIVKFTNCFSIVCLCVCVYYFGKYTIFHSLNETE